MPAVLSAQTAARPDEAQKPVQEQLDKLMEDWDRADRPGGSMVVIQDGRVTQRLGSFSMHPDARDQFLAMPSPFPLLVFDRDDGGRIRGLHVDTESLRGFSFERKP